MSLLLNDLYPTTLTVTVGRASSLYLLGSFLSANMQTDTSFFCSVKIRYTGMLLSVLIKMMKFIMITKC